MEEKPIAHSAESLSDVLELIRILRGRKGCPWDRKQTPRSISVYLIEEVFELVEAIESGRSEDVLEELGDVLFQVLFVAELFAESGRFTLGDVAARNLMKMRRRHPHVFGDTEVSGIEDIRDNWEAIKRREKKASDNASVLDSVPSGLPALMRAYRVSVRAARTGFDWRDLTEVMEKVEEEWREFKEAVRIVSGDKEAIALEFGDILFTLANVARFARIHPETALSAAIGKFQERFRYMESIARSKGRSLESLSRGEMDRDWEVAKAAVDGPPADPF